MHRSLLRTLDIEDAMVLKWAVFSGERRDAFGAAIRFRWDFT